MRLPLLALALAAVAGCGCKPDGGPGGGPTLRDAATFKADALPGEKARLVLAGTEIPVDVKRREVGTEVVLELWAHGQIVQQERYATTRDAFSLRTAGGEHYEPALPLVKFPMDVGAHWDWSGTMTAGERNHAAKGTVTTSSEQVYVPAPETAVKVQVALELESGGPQPAKRTLTFWFVEGRGVVKRAFGAGSAREPG